MAKIANGNKKKVSTNKNSNNNNKSIKAKIIEQLKNERERDRVAHIKSVFCDKSRAYKMHEHQKFYLLYWGQLRQCLAYGLESWLVIWALRQNPHYPPKSLGKLVRVFSALVCIVEKTNKVDLWDITEREREWNKMNKIEINKKSDDLKWNRTKRKCQCMVEIVFLYGKGSVCVCVICIRDG